VISSLTPPYHIGVLFAPAVVLYVLVLMSSLTLTHRFFFSFLCPFFFLLAQVSTRQEVEAKFDELRLRLTESFRVLRDDY